MFNISNSNQLQSVHENSISEQPNSDVECDYTKIENQTNNTNQPKSTKTNSDSMRNPTQQNNNSRINLKLVDDPHDNIQITKTKNVTHKLTVNSEFSNIKHLGDLIALKIDFSDGDISSLGVKFDRLHKLFSPETLATVTTKKNKPVSRYRPVIKRNTEITQTLKKVLGPKDLQKENISSEEKLKKKAAEINSMLSNLSNKARNFFTNTNDRWDVVNTLTEKFHIILGELSISKVFENGKITQELLATLNSKLSEITEIIGLLTKLDMMPKKTKNFFKTSNGNGSSEQDVKSIISAMKNVSSFIAQIAMELNFKLTELKPELKIVYKTEPGPNGNFIDHKFSTDELGNTSHEQQLRKLTQN